MKRVFMPLVLMFLFSLSACNSDVNSQSRENLQWETSIEKAVDLAKKENKQILVNFTGSDWCKWCIRLNKEVFSQKGFENYANENLILVKLDFPRSIEQSQQTVYYNRNKANEFGVRGFPTIVLLNKNGEYVGKTGYQPGGSENYVKILQSYFQGS